VPDSLIDLSGLLVAAEDLLSAVLEQAAQPLWVLDRNGVIRFANPAAVAVLGYEQPSELTGRRAALHHRREDGTPFPAAEYPLLRPLATGETAAGDEGQIVRRDGSAFSVSYVSVPIETQDGRAVLVAFTDIQDRLSAEQALGEQQASLRRLATLVAGGAASGDVFAAIAREVGRVVGLPVVAVWRYESDDTATVVGAWSDRPQPYQVGTRWPTDAPTIGARIRRTGRPARIDDYATVPGAVADAARENAIRSGAGAPIVVDGEVWGSMSTYSTAARLPDDIEARLSEFTELVAATFSTTARQGQLSRLADEQAALRRVATLVAQGVQAGELYRAVSEEVGRLVGADAAATIRYEPDDMLTAVGSWTAPGVQAGTEVGKQWPLAGESLAPRILRTGQPVRIDDWSQVPGPIASYTRTRLGVTSSVGSPILVEGRVWGNLAVHSTRGPLPPDTEARIARFTALVSTAILNAQARDDVQRLADEQTALRRVATLVARQRPPAEVFAAVTAEVGRLLPVETASMLRYEDDATATVVASWGELGSDIFVVGARLPVGGENVTAWVRRTGRPARRDDHETASGLVGDHMRELGINAAVGCPIEVDGRLWGVTIAAQRHPEPLPAGTESRIAQFTELIATAISNVQARSDLAASRARIAAAADEERRRVARDLHDGAQQRLVSAVITMKMMRAMLARDPDGAQPMLDEALDHCEQAMDDLRELAHGIMPTVLTRGGLRDAIDTLAARVPLPVDLDVRLERLPAAVEATAYFVVAEALTNVAKHARASRVSITAEIEDRSLHVRVRDDGVGGARPSGTGLLGLRDRLAAQDGRLRVESPADGGTAVVATIPLGGSPIPG
jgi:PAS domain S-box-containing protein